MSGTLVLDGAAGTLTIDVEHKGLRELRINEELEVEIDGSSTSSMALERGDAVTVHYEHDGGVDHAAFVRR